MEDVASLMVCIGSRATALGTREEWSQPEVTVNKVEAYRISHNITFASNPAESTHQRNCPVGIKAVLTASQNLCIPIKSDRVDLAEMPLQPPHNSSRRYIPNKHNLIHTARSEFGVIVRAAL